MCNKNTMSKAAYVFENVFWAIISMIRFKSILFRCIPGKTLTVANCIMGASVDFHYSWSFDHV